MDKSGIFFYDSWQRIYAKLFQFSENIFPPPKKTRETWARFSPTKEIWFVTQKKTYHIDTFLEIHRCIKLHKAMACVSIRLLTTVLQNLVKLQTHKYLSLLEVQAVTACQSVLCAQKSWSLESFTQCKLDYYSTSSLLLLLELVLRKVISLSQARRSLRNQIAPHDCLETICIYLIYVHFWCMNNEYA